MYAKRIFSKYKICLLLLLLLIFSCDRSGIEVKYPIESRTVDRYKISDEMYNVLTSNILEKWYPLCLDTIYGGYLSNFDYMWKILENQPKFIVTQARHLWALSKASEFFKGNEKYELAAKSGYKFLRNKMWDDKYGGFFELVSREGKLSEFEGSDVKKAYGNAFAMYGLAAYFAMTNDSSALDLAQNTFYWLEENSHDPEYGGYYQFMKRDGTAFKDGVNHTPPKDHNSSIHLLEAFTELYKVWPDELLRERLNEMLILIRDTMADKRGFLKLFFKNDWTHVLYSDSLYYFEENRHFLDHVSFGHDVETAYLMIEASEMLNLKNDTLTYKIAKKMVDHALVNGWNPNTGATYDAGYYFEGSQTITILNKSTQWWSACETFNAFLLMSELYAGDINNYYDSFTRTWNYCRNYLIDEEYGGWYRMGINEIPQSRFGNKGDIWKGNYHNLRALFNCINILRSESTH